MESVGAILRSIGWMNKSSRCIGDSMDMGSRSQMYPMVQSEDSGHQAGFQGRSQPFKNHK